MAYRRRVQRGRAIQEARADSTTLPLRPSNAGGKLDIRAGQKLAWENKVVKGFNTTDVPLEFCLLQGEMAEAFDAWRKDRGTIGEELADVALFLFSLAAMTGVDLQAEVEAKIEKNAARAYSRLPNGTLVKNARPGDGTRPGHAR